MERRSNLFRLAITFLFSFCVIVCFVSLPALSKLSKKQERRLNELTSGLDRPSTPIYGKLNDPLKAGVSIYDYEVEKINVESPETSTIAIKLPKEENKIESLSELETKRNELQKAELEGINFIQPSLELTSEEQKAIDEFFSRNEQEQLLNLWKSTIERNKTIQFIIQKLTPIANPQEKNSILSKTIGAAIFLPFYALQAITDNAGAYYGSQVGGRVLGSIVEGKMQKNQALLQLSQTETIILFMMIDEVAERLRQRYHAYKRLMVERALATNELEEAKQDTLDALEEKSAGAALIATIQRRAVEREIRRLDAETRGNKNALIELAGVGAVNELDEQLRIELAATQNTPLDF